ncbi:MAG: cysteine synthase A [Nitrospiraceae bacterium]|nr:Cysteine synthase [Nitrospira sp.]MDW7648515.1 cysteine synthase A [Nitrospiraceae bacterium]MDW7654958.1 cysteine synthase A [Nitrospiraceae bacterium]PHX90735.1 MAG: cysteine synthase A [Nitrospirota bacterium]
MTMPPYKDITELVGHTPLVRLNRLSLAGGATIYGKAEFLNPAGSIKDRICLNMINEAERLGHLKPGGTIVEPTSGNTGIGLALIAAVRGYTLILVMPETMSMERASLLSAYGAQLVMTAGWEGMKGAIREAENITAQNPSYFMPDQFSNPANPAMHKKTTAVEILESLDGKIDAFVAAVGTGGTITGCGELFKERNPNVKIIAVEPAGSPVLSGGEPGPHKIQGIGAGFIPKVLNRAILDRVITVTDDEAYQMAKQLSRKEGLSVGLSAGANVFAAQKVAQELEPGKNVVTILCDTGERYLSMEKYFNL